MSDFPNIKKTITLLSSTTALVRAFNLKNVNIQDVRTGYENIKEYRDDIVSKNPYKDAKKVNEPEPVANNYPPSKLSAGFVTPDPKLYDSKIGTPVFADLTLQGGTYRDNISGFEVNFPTIRLESVIMTIDFTARIVKTEIQGRNGTIKEYIGEDDASIAIQGVITGSNGVYPAYEVAQLNEWRKAPVAKGVTSTFLQNLGITNVVVESSSIPQVVGGYSYQTFTINCISDLPVELKIQ